MSSANTVFVGEFSGGTIGTTTMEVVGMPAFREGQRGVLLVASQVRSASPLVGFWYGRMCVERDHYGVGPRQPGFVHADDISGAQSIYGTALAVAGNVSFPPRNEPNNFFAQLLAVYQNELRAAPSATYVDPGRRGDLADRIRPPARRPVPPPRC